MSVRKSLLIAVALLLLVGVAACGTTVSQVKTPATLDEVPRITPQEVKALLDAGEDVLIVDTRSLAEYTAGHIAGAVSLPLTEITNRHQELPNDRLLALYCT